MISKQPKINEVIDHLIKFLYTGHDFVQLAEQFRSRFRSNTFKSFSIALSQHLGGLPRGLLLSGTNSLPALVVFSFPFD